MPAPEIRAGVPQVAVPRVGTLEDQPAAVLPAEMRAVEPPAERLVVPEPRVARMLVVALLVAAELQVAARKVAVELLVVACKAVVGQPADIPLPGVAKVAARQEPAEATAAAVR